MEDEVSMRTHRTCCLVLARAEWPRVRCHCQFVLAFLVLLFQVQPGHALQFGVSAAVQESPPQITLSWDTVPYGAANYTV